jgi:hypothetical protein
MKAPVSDLTERKLKLLEFWTALNDFLENKNSKVSPHKPSAHHWNNVSIGTSKAHISLTASARENKIAAELYIPDCKGLYFQLVNKKEEIEKLFGEELLWQELKDKKASRISINRNNFNLYDNKNWEKDFLWLEEKTLAFKKAFCPFININ